jgi:hypothetical protein
MAQQEQQETDQGVERVYRHTTPWMPSEYVKVNGRELVYSISRAGGMTIHFPGRRSASADVLRSMGFTVVMPRVLRKEQAA